MFCPTETSHYHGKHWLCQDQRHHRQLQRGVVQFPLQQYGAIEKNEKGEFRSEFGYEKVGVHGNYRMKTISYLGAKAPIIVRAAFGDLDNIAFDKNHSSFAF